MRIVPAILLATALALPALDTALAQLPQPGQTTPPDLQRRPRQRGEPPPADAQPAQATDARLGDVEAYFNGLRSFQARFVQNNPNGAIVQGTLSVRRPGRMRFEYDAPSELKIVADGSQVTMWDTARGDFGQWPIGWTAASFLVRDPVQLSGDLTVDEIAEEGELLLVTLVQTRKPQEGKVVIKLARGPLQLVGWTILDTRGNRVDVKLADFKVGGSLPDRLFRFDGPDPSQMRRNPN